MEGLEGIFIDIRDIKQKMEKLAEDQKQINATNSKISQCCAEIQAVLSTLKQNGKESSENLWKTIQTSTFEAIRTALIEQKEFSDVELKLLVQTVLRDNQITLPMPVAAFYNDIKSHVFYIFNYS